MFCRLSCPGLDSGFLGFGAYFNGAWFWGDWQPHQCLPLRSIQQQELFAIVAAASTWDHHWSGLCIHFHCDNLPIVISEELKRVVRWVQEHGDTIPGRKEAVPPPNVGSCLGIKADMMVKLSDYGGEVDQVAEEEPPCWHHHSCKGEACQ